MAKKVILTPEIIKSIKHFHYDETTNEYTYNNNCEFVLKPYATDSGWFIVGVQLDGMIVIETFEQLLKIVDALFDVELEKGKASFMKEDYLTVSIHMRVDGKIMRRKEETYYGRARETHAFDLDNFAQIIFMYEKMFCGGSTYAYDGLLQKMEKKLSKKDGITAESVFQKYWVNLEKTINDDFEEKNKGDNGEYAIFKQEGDYLKYGIVCHCDSFNRSALPIQYGFLYWLYKYVMNGSMDEMKKELENVPQSIKDLVDNHLAN